MNEITKHNGKLLNISVEKIYIWWKTWFFASLRIHITEFVCGCRIAFKISSRKDQQEKGCDSINNVSSAWTIRTSKPRSHFLITSLWDGLGRFMWCHDQLVDKKLSRISDIYTDRDVSSFIIIKYMQNTMLKKFTYKLNKNFIWSTSVMPLSFTKILREIFKIFISRFRSKLLFEK